MYRLRTVCEVCACVIWVTIKIKTDEEQEKQEKHKFSKRNAEHNVMFVWILLNVEIENFER